MNIDQFKKFPLSELTAPKCGGLYFIYHNMYWAVTKKNELLFFRDNYISPQCNPNKEVVENVLCKNIDCELRVELIEYVFVPRDYKDC